MRSLAGNLFTVIGMCFLFLAVSIFTGGTAQAGCNALCGSACTTGANGVRNVPPCPAGTCAGTFCGGACTCSPDRFNTGCLCK